MAYSVEDHKLVTFEKVTRHIRWLSVAIVLATFPLQSPQALPIFIFAVAVIVFNASRYVPFLYRLKFYRSPLVAIVIDSLFAGVLITLVGNISTPYSGLLVFMIVTSSYLYQLPGVSLVIAIEVAVLLGEHFIHPFPSLNLGGYQEIIITLFILIALGYLVSRLTDTDKADHEVLEKLKIASDSKWLRLLTLIDSLDSAIFVTDGKGRLLQMNAAAKQLITSPADAIGSNFSHVLRLRKKESQGKQRVNIIKDSFSVQRRRDLSITDADGKQVDLDINITRVMKNDAVAEYLIVCDDISQERTLEDQREGFISVASHELRTPLTIVEASLATALSTDQNLSDSTKAVLEQAHRNVLHLSNIIKDLAVLAAAQNDSIPIQLAWVSPSKLVEECMSDFELQAKQQGIALRKVLAKDLQLLMSTEHFIREILQNYLTNALKYSQKGTVTLKAEHWQGDGVRFSVADEGIGISQSDQKMIFTKFFRAEDYRTRTTGGVGLGLYLCMELANRLGAKVWFSSKKNEGSTFYLDVPKQSYIGRDQGEIIKTQVANLLDDI